MCGFVGMIGHGDVAPAISAALQALQHRGQDAAGIRTRDGERFLSRRALGLVRDAFSVDDVGALRGGLGIGHVRYPTLGSGSLDNAQPFFYRRPGVFMAHNGNITNFGRLRDELALRSVHVLSTCDVEPMLLVLAEALMDRRPADHTTADVVGALRETFRRVDGAYSFAVALRVDGRDTLIAARDPAGIRPGVWGERDGTYAAASESVALDAIDFPCAGDIPPGAALLLRAGEPPQVLEITTAEPAPCVFEEIYFARPDSVMGGHTIYGRRLLFGRLLARQWSALGLTCDRVVPVPDTSRPAATAFAEELGVPYREGFIKNRYSGRTFIMPDSDTRDRGLRLKLNPIRAEFEGKEVVVVDDSIVRGTTVRRIVELVRRQGAAAIHLVIHAPPVLFPCYYGIDMSTPEELVARSVVVDAPAPDQLELARAEVERTLAARLGVDSLTYLSVAALREARNGGRCMACFDGRYPSPVSDEDRAAIARNRRACCTRGAGLDVGA